MEYKEGQKVRILPGADGLASEHVGEAASVVGKVKEGYAVTVGWLGFFVDADKLEPVGQAEE